MLRILVSLSDAPQFSRHSRRVSECPSADGASASTPPGEKVSAHACRGASGALRAPWRAQASAHLGARVDRTLRWARSERQPPPSDDRDCLTAPPLRRRPAARALLVGEHRGARARTSSSAAVIALKASSSVMCRCISLSAIGPASTTLTLPPLARTMMRSTRRRLFLSFSASDDIRLEARKQRLPVFPTHTEQRDDERRDAATSERSQRHPAHGCRLFKRHHHQASYDAAHKPGLARRLGWCARG